MLSDKTLLEIVGDSSRESTRMNIDRSSERDFPIKLFALNSKSSYQRGIVQGFLWENGSSETSFNKFLDGLGVIRLHRNPQGQLVLLHHRVNQSARTTSAGVKNHRDIYQISQTYTLPPFRRSTSVYQNQHFLLKQRCEAYCWRLHWE